MARGPAFVGGVDDAVEGFGGLAGDWEEPDVVDHDQVGAQHAADGAAGGVVGAVSADEGAEGFETDSS